jgi:cellulose synthase/poly-beta-1,6-N-acetylglucosamine synthase-like glycosyltransferase
VVRVRPGLALTAAGATSACALAIHTAANLRFLRTPAPDAPEPTEPVTVLIPARDEVTHVAATVTSALAQTGVARLRVIVLDDGSSDGTADVLDALAADEPRLQVLHAADAPPPDGWLGKPWACARLARAADEGAEPGVLVFVDADVLLRPHAVRAVVATMREGGFALAAPYPFQEARTWLERLVQPLVTWSWVATMPLRWAESSTRPSLSAANGQLIAVDAEAYRAIGGHGAVRADVIEDVALMRAMKSAGRRTVTLDGAPLAACRMYEGAAAVTDGYAKSLWSAFGGPVGSVAVNALLVATYVVPAVAAVAGRDPRTRRVGLLGYAAGVASRALVARRTGERLVPDTLAHPASIAAFAALNAVSWQRHLRGANRWKGRPVVAA